MFVLGIEKQPEKFLRKLDKENRNRIYRKIEELKLNSKIGIPLIGNLAGFWKLRVGDFRIIYQIHNEKLLVIIVKAGNRKNVYD